MSKEMGECECLKLVKCQVEFNQSLIIQRNIDKPNQRTTIKQRFQEFKAKNKSNESSLLIEKLNFEIKEILIF